MQTIVTATLVDPNGLPYSFASVSAIISSTGPGAPLQGPVNLKADIEGNFTIALQPGIWTFTISPAPSTVSPSVAPIPPSPVAIAISGAAQDISDEINAVLTVLQEIPSQPLTNQIMKGLLSPPPDPPAGHFTLYFDANTGVLAAIDSNGNPAMPPATIAPGSDIDGGTY
jgi:hypothetical protein